MTVRHAAEPVGCNVPVDTDAVSPDSIPPAVMFGISRMVAESEARGTSIDWNTVVIDLEPKDTDPSTTLLRVRAKRLI